VRQDDDVLDTWFSSQLWPFATQSWPDGAITADLDAGNQDIPERHSRASERSEDGEARSAERNAGNPATADLEYYPTQVLSTARDIIFLWVARMVMASLDFIGEVPFKDVIIHPTVLDAKGNIMSKSRGNGIDPLKLIEEYGADGMRFGLALQVTGSQDMKFDKDKLLSSRNFATKIWNAARFVKMNLEDYEPGEGRVQPTPKTDADRWILSRLARLAYDMDDGKEGYDFGAVARELYHFFWNEFCDWYIEFAKGQLAEGAESRAATQRNLVFVLDTALRLLHPFMPFVTEEIWLSLPTGDDTPSLMVADWPSGASLEPYVDEAAEAIIDKVRTIVEAIRSTRSRYHISPKEALDVRLRTLGDDAAGDAAVIEKQALLIHTLANTAHMTVAADIQKPEHSSVTVAPGLEIYVLLEGLVNFDEERKRLQKEHDKVAADLAKLAKKLANEGFIAKAAPEIVEKTRTEADELAATLSQIDEQLELL
jgi:valyl-tRNA synthetase